MTKDVNDLSITFCPVGIQQPISTEFLFRTSFIFVISPKRDTFPFLFSILQGVVISG